MKIFALVSIARQVDGEYCVVKIEKAYKSAQRADDESKKLARKYAESITTPAGVINCVCERGVFEIDVED